MGRRHPDTRTRILWADAADAAGRERGRYDFVYFDIWPTPPMAEQVVEVREIIAAAQPDARLISWAETPLEESTGGTHFLDVVGIPAACTV